MNGHDIATIIGSKSFQYFVGTVCLVILIHQVKSVIFEVKEGRVMPKAADKKTV